MPLSDYMYLVLELFTGYILLLALRLLYRRFERTGKNQDRQLFLFSILGLVLYVLITYVELTDQIPTGIWFHFHNIGVYSFIILELGLLVQAFRMTEQNELNLEKIVEEKSEELVENKLKEHEEIDKLRRQHTQELITGARRLSEQINDGIDKPIRSSLNMIFLMKQNPDLYETYADSIEEQLERVSHVVEDVKKKTSVGELKIGFEDIGELIQKTIDSVHMPVGVKVVFDPQFHALAIDPVKMFLVFENIIENAVEAMGNTGVLGIFIEADNGELHISVSDTGPGISEEDKPKVFTPFFTRKEDGLGLGLVYCKDVVMAHGGAITFESDSKGTTFTVTLPKTSNYVL